ncbi:serine/arginine repetitive matrix protein 2-like isoform X1 [Eriocheir sinensis]|uniref:serine/arginine repetitive matrix protein 2-like isoform X1 n=1 Tax=Eriocheir sinensis TaxID=95602 RepID=UPI0021C8D5FA|nr:serine/arginine repetitive matrix protein 2-like isoform X1 [Eriocheir sinensis]
MSKGGGVPRGGGRGEQWCSLSGPQEREREASGPRQRPQRPRPRTIHIDVYCSSSDDQDSSPPSSPSSPDTRGSTARRPHAVVALGSKQRDKTEVSLSPRRHHHPLEQRTSSFVYSRPSPEAAAPAPRSTFITDDDLPLCSSPTEPPPASPPLTPTLGRRPSDYHRSPIPMPAPPQRPTTLAVPPCSVAPDEEGEGAARRSHQSSLSYLSSPLEGDTWEGDLWEADQDLSWRGSEFEVSTPRLISDMELAAARAASEVSLGSLHEAGGEGSPRMWRSPQLERQRYMQRGQEDRHREVLLRRTQQLRQQAGEAGQQQQQQRSLSGTPTSVAQLERLSAFKKFSREDLQVISKSLERRESQRSQEQDEPFTLPQQRESFRPVVEKDANRLLEWMQQYKAQERRASEGVAQQARYTLRPGEVASGHPDGVDRKESYCSVGRRRSFPGTSGGFGRGGAGHGVQRGDSLKSLEMGEMAAHPAPQRTAPTPTRPLEKKSSFKFQDKQQFFRSLERRDSGTVADAPPQRRGSGRLERRGSGRLAGAAGRGGESQGTPGDGDHLTGTASQGRSGSKEDTTTAEPYEPEAGWRRPSSGLLGRLLEREEEQRPASAEWQDVAATVRRRLSPAAQDAPAAPKPSGAPQSPSAQRRRRRASPPRTEEVGGRHITVGAFRHLARFPFSQTVPVPAARALAAARTACEPEQRKFVRPQLFGEMTFAYPSRRGIHYGPPRNPQCSCRNCRAWSDQPRENDPAPACRLRAWSLTDLGSGAAERPLTPLRPATALSRTSSSVSDHSSSGPHVGSAAAGREQS